MNVSLRPWSLDDLDILVRYANNFNIAQNMTDAFPHPYSEENGRAFIGMTTQHNPTQIFAVTLDNQLVGSIGLFPQSDIMRKNAELGYWLAEPFWGKGIMPVAVGLMVQYGFETWDLTRIFARPFGRNIGSQKVLEKAGFILEARFEKTIFKNGVFEDELVYALRK
ncbi:MAG: GNAT family protein [Bacteroidota bacterium]